MKTKSSHRILLHAHVQEFYMSMIAICSKDFQHLFKASTCLVIFKFCIMLFCYKNLLQRGSPSNAAYFFTSCYLQVRYMKFSEKFTMTLLKVELFFHVVSSFVNSLLVPLLPHSSAVIYARLSAMPRHWRNGVLHTPFFQRTKQVKI